MLTFKFVQHSAVAGIVGLLGLLNAHSSQAGVMNGDFEDGFAGYSTIGDTIVHTGSFESNYGGGHSEAVISNTPGAEVDFTFSGNPAVSTANLETFLGLSAGSFDAIASDSVIEGSAIQQTFYGNANDILSFDFQFLTDEDVFAGSNRPNANFNDLAFFTVQFNNSPAYIFQLADTFSNFSNSNTPFIYETNGQNTALSLAQSGYYTIGFGVLDVGDESFASSLLLDNIGVTSSEPVPEPATMLGLTAFSFGAFMKRRQKQKAKA
ncbi:PEP-CTERM sorting domain-containing protein [Synechocystis sp. PCC 7509]|uniref:PEP-CTERM sorting domain-containing protein n=1 Tax=Synechocystis sp. PCC 7509 TaxID=927677 RepID=UPI0002ABCCC1|nr:PEP-CTERM sorting domain-containing protein [Synechocystis sp. PCC 7509]